MTAPEAPAVAETTRRPWGRAEGRTLHRSALPVPARSWRAGDGGRAAPFEEGHHVGPVRDGVRSTVGGHHAELPQPPVRQRQVGRCPPPQVGRHPAELAQGGPPQIGPADHGRRPGPGRRGPSTGRWVAVPSPPILPHGGGDRGAVVRATAAAPTRGPSAPRPAGSMRVGRANSRPQRSVELLAGGVEEVVAVTEGHRTGHHGQLQVEQAGDRRHRPADQGAAAAAHSVVRLGRRAPGHRRDRRPRRLGLQAAPTAADARPVRRARRPRDRCARRCRPIRRAGARRGRCHRRSRWTPPWPGSRCWPRAAPLHPSPRARALASLSTATGSPVRSASLPQGEPTPAVDVEGAHRGPAGLHRPAAAHAAGHRSHLGPVEHLGHDPGQRPEDGLRIGRGRCRVRARSRMRPSGVTIPASILVPRCRRRGAATSPSAVGCHGREGATGRQAISRRWADVACRRVSRRGGSAHGSSHGDRGPDC